MSQLANEIKDLTSVPTKAMLNSCTGTLSSSAVYGALSALAMIGIHTHARTEPEFRIYKDVNANEWKSSLVYDDSQVDDLITKLLENYGIKPTSEVKDWLKNSVNNLISVYQKEYGIVLPDKVLKMIFNLVVRMSYDRLVVDK